MSLGCLTFQWAIWADQHLKKDKAISALATVVELSIFALIMRQMYSGENKLDFLAISVFPIMMISIFSCNSYLTKALNTPFSGFLGKMSFPMYLNQRLLITPLKNFCPGKPFWLLIAIIVIGDFLLSLCTERLTAFAVPKVAGLWKRLLKEPEQSE